MENEEHITIDINDPEDLSFWATQFEITEAELKAAIAASAPNVDAVTEYLQK